MQLQLRDGVHAAGVGEDLVLLDVLADRYLCLPAALQAQPCGGRELSADALQRLAAAGLLGSGAASAGPPPRPTMGLPAVMSAKARPADWVRLGLSLLDLLSGYAGRSFRQVLQAGAAGSRLGPAAPSDEVLRLARVFEDIVVWAPVSRKCLVRSFLLMRFLARAGHRAQWVFGVRAWPFAAHCWVQSGDTVLDDAPDRLARYNPILAV
jgi:hypothetical protein